MNSEYLAVGVINQNYFSVNWGKVHRPSYRTYIVNLLHQITECFIPRYWKPESAANKGKKVHINTYLNTILPFFASFIGATYMISSYLSPLPNILHTLAVQPPFALNPEPADEVTLQNII